jgi:CheY-like chemotaxis protein
VTGIGLTRRARPAMPVPRVMPRILVVDDDPGIRELVELTLEGSGHLIDSVDSGRAALERLAEHAYDLVVCDLHMPDRDGPAVYRAITRRSLPRPAFLFITGYAEAGPYEKFLRAAEVPVLVKPFAITVLRGAVRRILTEA